MGDCSDGLISALCLVDEIRVGDLLLKGDTCWCLVVDVQPSLSESVRFSIIELRTGRLVTFSHREKSVLNSWWKHYPL